MARKVKINEEEHNDFRFVTQDEVRKAIKKLNDRITICESRHKETDPILVDAMHTVAKYTMLEFARCSDYRMGIIEPMEDDNGHMHIPTSDKAIKIITDSINEVGLPLDELNKINMISVGTVRQYMDEDEDVEHEEDYIDSPEYFEYLDLIDDREC